MIYYGLGEGTIIERNKARINYVQTLGRDINKLTDKIDKLINSIVSKDIKNIEESIGEVFFERISHDEILDMSDKFTYIKNIEEFKKEVIKTYIHKPKMGYIWNFYNVIKEVSPC